MGCGKKISPVEMASFLVFGRCSSYLVEEDIILPPQPAADLMVDDMFDLL